MAWRQPGAKPLFEPMMIILLTHICVTRPQWVKKIYMKETISLIFFFCCTREFCPCHKNYANVAVIKWSRINLKWNFSMWFQSSVKDHSQSVIMGLGNGLPPNWLQSTIQITDYQDQLCSIKTPVNNELTHWGWDKMAVISQTEFSNKFLWMKTFLS